VGADMWKKLLCSFRESEGFYGTLLEDGGRRSFKNFGT